jgi:hypothetical protein
VVPVLIYYREETGFPLFFHLPIIALAIVTVPVLCVIQYCLAVITTMVISRMEGWEERESKESKEKGKTNKQT